MAQPTNPIVPTKAEKARWKRYLYDACDFLATERPEFAPSKRDSLQTLLESFLSWAENYNEGWFNERRDAPTDRYAQWLVEQYERIYGPYRS